MEQEKEALLRASRFLLLWKIFFHDMVQLRHTLLQN